MSNKIDSTRKIEKNLFLTGEELEALSGHLGQLLDEEDLGVYRRAVLEKIYIKIATELGVW
jgi:hypothetical protein